jgi:hypothetical protein
VSLFSAVRGWSRLISYLGQNVLSLIGAVLTTSSAITLLIFWGATFSQTTPPTPYIGILLILVLPGIFILGLVLIPIGAILRRYRLRRRGQLPAEYPKIDFANLNLRRATALVAGASFMNIVILSVASYRGVQYMDSASFCGTACHVMAPQHIGNLHSPHSAVECAECHVGPGASGFIRAKLAGVRQVRLVTFGTYPRPIIVPADEIVSARDTCEKCHAAGRFIGQQLVIHNEFATDEKNTVSTTVLMVNVGGMSPKGPVGIHGFHLNPAARITFIATDPQEQNIPQVTYRGPDGKTTVFTVPGTKLTPEQIAGAETRVMNCQDCHNRVGHAFQTPDQALDAALNSGEISPDLPFIKKEGIEVLRANYPDTKSAQTQIAESIQKFYAGQSPQLNAAQHTQMDQAITAIQGIYARNVFPAMKVTWGTYPNNLGHTDYPGCFRCHDGNHTSADGKTIPNDCSTCHNVLAMQESNPKILSDLGLK